MSAFHIRDRRRLKHLRRFVLNRDKYRCRKCGKAGMLEADHVKPVHDGGDPFDPANLQALCRSCHFAKTAKENSNPVPPDVREWRDLLLNRTL